MKRKDRKVQNMQIRVDQASANLIAEDFDLTMSAMERLVLSYDVGIDLQQKRKTLRQTRVNQTPEQEQPLCYILTFIPF